MTFYAKRGCPGKVPKTPVRMIEPFSSCCRTGLSCQIGSALRPTCRSCRLYPWPAGTLIAQTAVLHMRSWPQPAHGTWKQKLAAKLIYSAPPSTIIFGTHNSSNREFTLIPSTIWHTTAQTENLHWFQVDEPWSRHDNETFYEWKIIIASTIAVWLSCTSTTQKHQHSDILQLSQLHQRNLIIVRHIEPPSFYSDWPTGPC
jgi:hypothetical protein